MKSLLLATPLFVVAVSSQTTTTALPVGDIYTPGYVWGQCGGVFNYGPTVIGCLDNSDCCYFTPQYSMCMPPGYCSSMSTSATTTETISPTLPVATSSSSSAKATMTKVCTGRHCGKK